MIPAAVPSWLRSSLLRLSPLRVPPFQPPRVLRTPRQPTALIRTLVIGLVVCLLVSCSGSRGASDPAASSGDHRAAAQTALDALTTAVTGRDRAAYEQLISVRDGSFDFVADRIFDNLTTMGLVTLDFRAQSRTSPLAAARRAALGPQAFVQQVSVSWRLPGDREPAQHLLWLTFLPVGSRLTVAGTSDGPADRVAQPIWLVERVSTRRQGRATVLAAQGAAVRTWVARGDAAAAATSPRLLPGFAARWNRDLVIEVPSSRQVFEQVLGVAPGSYAQIAAVAWPEGTDAGAAVRIIVNPDLAGRLDAQALDVLLAHEATHVATRSAVSSAPSWLVEGFADEVAYDAYPRTAGTAAAALLAHVRADGPPKALPTDAQLGPTAEDLPLEYAESWLACRYLADHYSERALERFYLAVDTGTSVDAALRSVTGADEGAFVARWSRSLRDRARQR